MSSNHKESNREALVWLGVMGMALGAFGLIFLVLRLIGH